MSNLSIEAKTAARQSIAAIMPHGYIGSADGYVNCNEPYDFGIQGINPKRSICLYLIGLGDRSLSKGSYME